MDDRRKRPLTMGGTIDSNREQFFSRIVPLLGLTSGRLTTLLPLQYNGSPSRSADILGSVKTSHLLCPSPRWI